MEVTANQLECKVDTDSIVNGASLFSTIGDFCIKNADAFYETIANVLEIAKDHFEIPQAMAHNVSEALETAGAGFGIVSTFADSLDFVGSAISCAEVAHKGIFSDDFMGGVVDVIHDFGFMVSDIYASAIFLTALKVVDAVNPVFRTFSLAAFTVSVVIDIYDNVCVLSDGSKGKESLTDVKKDLIKLNHQRNIYDLIGNLVSLSLAVAGLAGMAFCPLGTYALAFTAFGTSYGEFYYKRQMQIVTADAALAIE